MALSLSRMPARAFMSLEKSIRDRAYSAHQRVVPLPGNPILVVGSAHKVGSTWAVDLLSDLFRLPRLRVPPDLCEQRLAVDVPIENLFPLLSSKHRSVIHKTHALPPPHYPPKLGARIKLITITRDPRDLLVSAAHYLANLPESLGGWGPSFAALSVKERLLWLIEHGDFLLDRLDAWARQERAVQIRYEDLKQDPLSVLRSVSWTHCLPFDERRARAAIKRNIFERKARRKSGTEDPGSFFRKGIVGDWKSNFDDEVIRAFLTCKAGRWSALASDLGYR